MRHTHSHHGTTASPFHREFVGAWFDAETCTPVLPPGPHPTPTPSSSPVLAPLPFAPIPIFFPDFSVECGRNRRARSSARFQPPAVPAGAPSRRASSWCTRYTLLCERQQIPHCLSKRSKLCALVPFPFVTATRGWARPVPSEPSGRPQMVGAHSVGGALVRGTDRREKKSSRCCLPKAIFYGVLFVRCPRLGRSSVCSSRRVVPAASHPAARRRAGLRKR